jgi:hypothetical protein
MSFSVSDIRVAQPRLSGWRFPRINRPILYRCKLSDQLESRAEKRDGVERHAEHKIGLTVSEKSVETGVAYPAPVVRLMQA